MELKKLVPWNWFNKEDEYNRQPAIAVHHPDTSRAISPVHRFHSDIDRIFDEFFRSFGFPGFGREVPAFAQSEWLKPTVDVAAGEKEYSISVEIPGVEEKDFSLDLSEGTLRIRGEKRQEKEEKEMNYYRMERSFGSFQRVISLPEDVDEEGITARYSNGVLKITLPRKSRPKPESRKIPIGSNTGSGNHKQITG